jgi:transcriptional regulator GlxA family with amidase domain
MQENLEEKLTIDRLAELAHMNRFHFIRAFKQAFGQSPL